MENESMLASKLGKRITHMGMTITEEEHEKWHRESQEIAAEQHDGLMKKMGVSEEEDEEWHKTHRMPPKPSKKQEEKPVNPFAVGGGFLDYCVRQGWLIQEGKGKNAKYYVTKEDEEEIKKFGVKI